MKHTTEEERKDLIESHQGKQMTIQFVNGGILFNYEDVDEMDAFIVLSTMAEFWEEKLVKLGRLREDPKTAALKKIADQGYPSRFNTVENLVQVIDENIDLAKEALRTEIE